MDIIYKISNSRIYFIIKLMIALIFFGASVFLATLFKTFLQSINVFEFAYGRFAYAIVVVVSLYLGFYAYVKIIEKRTPTEYSIKHIMELYYGIGLGAGLVMLQVLILWILGYYRITSISFTSEIITSMSLMLVIGFMEELLSRGIFFRLLEEGLGSKIAIICSALEVGMTHVSNEGASSLSTLSVMIEFGVMLALFFMVSRRLWLISGFHFAWNFTMGGIFGLTVSGLPVLGLIKSEITGPMFLTGGSFGIEAAAPAVILCSSISIYLVSLLIKKEQVEKTM